MIELKLDFEEEDLGETLVYSGYEIMDQGEYIGSIVVKYYSRMKILHILSIDLMDPETKEFFPWEQARNMLGPTKILQLARQLKILYPKATRLTADRDTGMSPGRYINIEL